jgi:hypothetical protein
VKTDLAQMENRQVCKWDLMSESKKQDMLWRYSGNLQRELMLKVLVPGVSDAEIQNTVQKLRYPERTRQKNGD